MSEASWSLYVQSLEAHLRDAQLRLAAAERVVEAARKIVGPMNAGENVMGEYYVLRDALAEYEKESP